MEKSLYGTTISTLYKMGEKCYGNYSCKLDQFSPKKSKALKDNDTHNL